MAATVLGSSLAMLDGTVVNVALPRIGEDLGAEVAGLQWVLSGYTLTLASLILFGGALGDRVGRRRVFVWGTVWFAGASALCALAPNVTILVAARLLQGVGAALLTPGSLAIISASFDEEDQGAAIGLWSGLGGVAAAVGPLLGGWLVEVAGWRSVFLINLPLAVAVVWVSARHVPETLDPHPPERLDVLGSALAALALGALTYGLIETAVWAVIAGLVLMAAFVVVERRSRYALVPGSLFASRVFVAANLVTLAVYAALGGVFFLLLLQLQIVSGYSPLAAGVASLPITILMLLLSSRAGRWAQIHGPRIPMTVGPLLGAGGLLLMLRIGPARRTRRRCCPRCWCSDWDCRRSSHPSPRPCSVRCRRIRPGLRRASTTPSLAPANCSRVAALPALAGIGADASRTLRHSRRASAWRCSSVPGYS